MTDEKGFCKMLTREGKALEEIPWNTYPRPMMKRDSYFCLNGKWEFGVRMGNEPDRYDREILVPFAPESLLSGIDRVFPEEATLLYRRSFSLPHGFKRDRVLLHFGAVDQVAEVYLNDRLVTAHTGGYTPFSVDITEDLREENVLKVEVTDRLSERVLPYGKQCGKRGGMWYTPVSGIWQTVWLESVPTTYIKHVDASPVGSFVKITIDGVNEAAVTVVAPDGEKTVLVTKNGVAELALEKPFLWTPESPYLYRYTVETGEDKVESYFAVRTLTIEEVNGVKRLCLNGSPYFFHGLLDQGYFSDGIFTPASPAVYTREIERVKALGFNTLRKHIKLEPQIFYAECDRLGMIVWQDMVNNGKYDFLRDTALPTLGLVRKSDKRSHKNAAQRKAFLDALEETVKLLRGHPCICYWTIFNEGWGQFDSDGAYKKLKALDDTRFIDSTSGWFRAGASDVDSRHIYFRKVKVKPSDKPVVISEFGGYTYSVKGHVFNTTKSYGYGECKTREAFVEKIRSLYLDELVPAVKNGVCGAIYTQVSDVEDEINGIFTYDREAEKLLPEEFAGISAALWEALEERT